MLEKQLKPAGGPKGINKKYVFMFSLNYFLKSIQIFAQS